MCPYIKFIIDYQFADSYCGKDLTKFKKSYKAFHRSVGNSSVSVRFVLTKWEAPIGPYNQIRSSHWPIWSKRNKCWLMNCLLVFPLLIHSPFAFGYWSVRYVFSLMEMEKGNQIKRCFWTGHQYPLTGLFLQTVQKGRISNVLSI